VQFKSYTEVKSAVGEFHANETKSDKVCRGFKPSRLGPVTPAFAMRRLMYPVSERILSAISCKSALDVTSPGIGIILVRNNQDLAQLKMEGLDYFL
jgi:hypothetical protein